MLKTESIASMLSSQHKEVVKILQFGGIPKTKVILWQFSIMCPNMTKYWSLPLDNPVPNSRIKYTSPDMQNEIIGISGDMIREKIVTACNNSEYFALIGDEATDVLTHDQVSVCVRFVDSTGGKVTLREEFLGFVRANETTGENLAELFLITLENFGIVIDNMRAQAFIEVFKPGLGNGFQQCNTYIVRRMF